MSISITPCLLFKGNCAEALKFYQRALDGVIDAKTTFGDLTADQQKQVLGLGFAMDDPAEKIVWARLKILNGDEHIELSDSFLAFNQEHAGHAISLAVREEADANRWFDNLSQEGKITLPLRAHHRVEMFGTFGMVTDKFGIEWVVRVMPIPQPDTDNKRRRK